MRRVDGVGAIAMLASALVAGCAAGTVSAPAGHEPPGLDPDTAQEVAADLARGGHARAEVTSRLGNAIVVRFDSGYEVWVYRIADSGVAKHATARAKRGETQSDAAGELVILLAPSGEVVKVRTRLAPAPAPRPARGAPGG